MYLEGMEEELSGEHGERNTGDTREDEVDITDNIAMMGIRVKKV